MSDPSGELAFAQSIDFFQDPSSYTGFDLDRGLRRIIGCIDPRNQEGDVLKTVVQTAGGAAGEGVDNALGLIVAGREDVTIEMGLAADKSVRHTVKLCAHHGCKFMAGMDAVFSEMIEPSDFTQETYDRWVRYYEFGDVIGDTMVGRVQDAAKTLRERKATEAELIGFIDELYPDTANIATMTGDNNARIYVVNHHPNAGLNRHKKHRVVGVDVQGYHDSLGATIADIQASRIPKDVRTPRLAAHMLKEAATRTVIGSGHDDTRYLEVQMSHTGAQIAEVEGPKAA